MGWLILTLILGLIGISGIVYAANTPEGVKGYPGVIVSVVAGLIWIVLTIFISLSNIGQRETGVVENFSGTLVTTKAPGTVATWPWQHVKIENVGIEKETFIFDAGNSAVSADQQPITAQVTINYQVEPQDVLPLWKSVGPNWRSVLLEGRVPQDFKETTAQFTSPEITSERPKLRSLTLERLRAEMCPSSVKNPPKDEPYCVHVVDVFISNIGYSDEYTKAIEAKQVQVQQALQAKAKVAQARYEADQAAATASGVARSTLLKAQADAKALKLKGKALKDNPQILQLEAIDKLNPNAEVIICTGSGSGNCPSFLPQATTAGK